MRSILFASLACLGLTLQAANDISALAQAGDEPVAVPHSRPARPYAFTGPVGYAPAQVRHAYGLDQLPNGGAGQVVGVVVAYGSPTMQNDLNVFCNQFGLPRTTLQVVYGTRKPVKSDAGWALETSMDVQWVHAVAPNATIVVSVAYSAGISDLIAAVDAAVKAGAKVVTMSWGAAEFSTEVNYDSHFQKSGVTFFAASGDKGSTSGTFWPATSPNVTSVGGTTLHLDLTGNLTSPETAWSGSGGGFSLYFAAPSFQSGWQTSVKRAYPDIALVADPVTGLAVYDSTPYNNSSGWWQLGGTSASSPLCAAVVALANEQRVAKAKPTLTGGQKSLYVLAGSVAATTGSLYPYYFYDVTAGNTGNYSATAKYDETTGLGSPEGQNLVPALSAQ
jgi:subtilase family serine protease